MIPPLLEIIQPITDEEACIGFSIEHGLVYGQPRCARCRKSTYRHGRVWRCTNHPCGWSKSIFKDSVFGNTRLPPQVVLLIGYLWLTKCSHTSMQLITGCFFNRLIRLMRRSLIHLQAARRHLLHQN